MKKILLILSLFVLLTDSAYAQRGCCSHHGGVAGCSSSGRQVCNDGTLSPSCTCTPDYVYGCTDRNATNYNSNANKDDGSCKYPEPVKSPEATQSSAARIKTDTIKIEDTSSDEDNPVVGVVGTLALASGGYYLYKKKHS